MKVPGPGAKGAASREDYAVIVGRVGPDAERPVLRVRPVADGKTVGHASEGAGLWVEAAPTTAVIPADGPSEQVGTTVVGPLGHALAREVQGGRVVGDGLAMELDRDPFAGVDAGHEVLGAGKLLCRGGQGWGGRRGLAKDGQDGNEAEAEFDGRHCDCKGGCVRAGV